MPATSEPSGDHAVSYQAPSRTIRPSCSTIADPNGGPSTSSRPGTGSASDAALMIHRPRTWHLRHRCAGRSLGRHPVVVPVEDPALGDAGAVEPQTAVGLKVGE